MADLLQGDAAVGIELDRDEPEDGFAVFVDRRDRRRIHGIFKRHRLPAQQLHHDLQHHRGDDPYIDHHGADDPAERGNE